MPEQKGKEKKSPISQRLRRLTPRQGKGAVGKKIKLYNHNASSHWNNTFLVFSQEFF